VKAGKGEDRGFLAHRAEHLVMRDPTTEIDAVEQPALRCTLL
jgi:hypothetical protein